MVVLSPRHLQLAIALCGVGFAGAANKATGDVAPFYSRPDIVPIALNVTLCNQSKVSPGYIFLAPYQVEQPGPYIFDSNGSLVWTGYGQVGPQLTHNFHVCSYKGKDHLCSYQGNQIGGYARGHGLIFDNQFRTVASVESGNAMPAADLHELMLTDNGESALITIFHPIQYDLSNYTQIGSRGYLLQGVFQEIDLESGKVKFEWNSLDHVDPSAGYVLPNTSPVSGNGSGVAPWDYFHINSVDKDSRGDYLVSSRHTGTIYKISGTDGKITWQLGGKDSTFDMMGFNFSYQHNARFVSSNTSVTVISFYDNASNGLSSSASASAGKVVSLDTNKMVATLLQSYETQKLSFSQGNLQLLPNGNAFMGHGSSPMITEMTADGTLIYSAHFAENALQYRSFKCNFTSNPNTSPALYAYARNTTAPTTFYVSWNGATEVANWRFFGGNSRSELAHVGSAGKDGFETVSTSPSFVKYVQVEAIASNGTSLRNSSICKTFVPHSELPSACDGVQCPLGAELELSPQVAMLASAST